MQATVYSKIACPQCDAAKQLLKSRNISFYELLIGRDVTREEVIEQFPNVRQVPIILVDGVFVGGLSELRSYLATLGEGEHNGNVLLG